MPRTWPTSWRPMLSLCLLKEMAAFKAVMRRRHPDASLGPWLLRAARIRPVLAGRRHWLRCGTTSAGGQVDTVDVRGDF